MKKLPVEKLMEDYIYKVNQSMEIFIKFFKLYIENNSKYKDLSYKIYEIEKETDLIKKEIELKFFEGKYFAKIRKDFINLFETIDLVMNCVKANANLIVLTSPEFPASIIDDIIYFIEKNISMFNPFLNIKFSHDISSNSFIKESYKSIQLEEQFIDELERQLIKKVFHSEIELEQKILLKKIIEKIADISDYIENASDKLRIMVLV